ncbi:MAG: tetratricopeptide repeat protein [Myxococcota bacterium]
MNKDKLLASAQANKQKGQFKKAIADYEKILEGDPQDLRVRLNLANLYLQQGSKGRAVETFLGVAGIYEDGGFSLKAIAVYKQILKIVPERADLHVALASNYQQHGLLNEAADEYREALKRLDAAGDQLGKLNVIRHILELDPDNVPDRLRLAEAYSAMGQIGDAVREFRRVAETLDEMGYPEDFQRTAERLLYHQPNDAATAKRLAASYAASGQAQRALPKLKVAYRATPRDLEVLRTLANSFSQLGQSHKAVAVLKEMARLYDQSGLERERDDCYGEILVLNPDDESARRAVAPRAAEAEAGRTIEFDEGEEPVEEKVAEAKPRRADARPAGMETADMSPAQAEEARRTAERIGEGGEAGEGATDEEAAAAAEALIEQMIREAIEEEPEGEPPPQPPPPPPAQKAERPEAEAGVGALLDQAMSEGREEEAPPPAPEAAASGAEAADDLDDFEFELDEDEEEFGFGGGGAEKTIADNAFIPEDVLKQVQQGVDLVIPEGEEAPREELLEEADELLKEELQELDFYIANHLEDEARLLLEELEERYPNHPHVKRREEKVARMG